MAQRICLLVLVVGSLEACHGEACSPPRPGCDIARPTHRPRTLASGERAVHEQQPPKAAPLIDPFSDGGPSCDFPSIDLGAWVAAHGAALPSYPVVFARSAATAPMLERWHFPDGPSFVSHFATTELWLEPGYTQAGGHLAHVKGVPSRLGRAETVAALAAGWSDALRGFYSSEFNCNSTFCRHVVHRLAVPAALAEPPSTSSNLLFGGPGSGLPFHRHKKTWQLQARAHTATRTRHATPRATPDVPRERHTSRKPITPHAGARAQDMAPGASETVARGACRGSGAVCLSCRGMAARHGGEAPR